MRLNKILISLVGAYLLVGITTISCSSGTNNNSQAPQAKPQGPVSYMQIDDMFSNPKAQPLQSKQLNSAGGCGSVMSDTGTGLVLASGFVSFIPVAGPVLGAFMSTAGTITGFAGANSANNCVSQTLANQQYQLAVNESQIIQLNNQMASSNNIIWNAIANNSYAALKNAYSNYNASTSNILTANGFVSTFLQKSGFWVEGSDFEPVAGYSIESLLANNQNYDDTYFYLNGINQVANSLTNATGVNISVVSSNNFSTTTYNVTPNNNSNIMNLYYSAYNYATNKLTQDIESNNTNIIDDINQYNNYIVNIYTNSLVALNAAYQTAYLVNMINYQNYVSGAQQKYLPPVLTLTGTYYNPAQYSSESQITAYNNIQQSLTSLVAGMTNQLYNNTISYIITDPMTAMQSLDTAGNLQYVSAVTDQVVQAESISYAALGKNTESATALIVQAIGNGLTLNNNNYQSSFQNSFYNAQTGYQNKFMSTNFGQGTLMFYQFPGVGNIFNINRSLVQYNELYGNAGNMNDFLTSYMPSESINATYSIMTTGSNGSSSFVESAIASTTTIQPYYINLYGYPQISGSVTNNILACNGTGSTIAGGLSPYNFYVYSPNGVNPSLGQRGVPYFMCGNWSTSGIQTQITNKNTNEVATYYSGLAPNFYKYNDGTLIIYSNLVSNNPTYGLTGDNLSACLSGSTGAGKNQNEYCGNFPTTGNTITMMNFNTQNWGNGSNRTNNSVKQGSSSSSIFTGWMADNYPSGLSNGDAVTNLAAIQITLPDGFIAPLVVANTNISGLQGTYIGMGYNPNVASVAIDGQPLLNGSNALYGNTSTWGIVASNTQASYNGDNSHFFPIPAIIVNGNTIMINSNTWAPEGIYGNWAAQAYITLNPISCPAWTGPYSTQSSLLPKEGSGATGMTDNQIFNFVCTLPAYNSFFGG